MKSYKNLYQQIYPFSNLYTAYRAARRGKRHRAAVADFEFDLEPNLLALERELRDQTYRPGGYTHFYIYEPKQRLVSAAPFRDRVVHHALCQVIEPIWEARFIPTSFACRLGKGTHRALDQAQNWVRSYRYAFQGDIVKYFPCIDHEILRGLLAHHIADRSTLWLIDQILASGAGLQTDDAPVIYLPGDDLFTPLRLRALPIGNLTSQFWANVYLHPLDLFVKQTLRCPAYLRYMDDFVLFSHDKAQLHVWHQAIGDFLAARLRLTLHPRKSVVFPTRVGLDFCGFRLFDTHRRLRRSSLRRFVRRFRRQRQAYHLGQLSLADWQTSLGCWIAHAAHGDTWRLRQRLFQTYPIGAKK
jgi:retron-type reverse transcriptase